MCRGGVKREYYKRLVKRYKVKDSWHVSPYELRQYAQETVKYINAKQPAVVVEVGCGFGEIIRRIQAKIRIGIDIMPEQIEVAKLLAKGQDVTYQVGSFGDINLEGPIDYLLALDFLHCETGETWRPDFCDVAERNDVRHFIVDTFPEGIFGDSHYIDFSKVLPDNYKLINKMGPYLGEHYIEVYEKTVQN